MPHIQTAPLCEKKPLNKTEPLDRLIQCISCKGVINRGRNCCAFSKECGLCGFKLPYFHVHREIRGADYISCSFRSYTPNFECKRCNFQCELSEYHYICNRRWPTPSWASHRQCAKCGYEGDNTKKGTDRWVTIWKRIKTS